MTQQVFSNKIGSKNFYWNNLFDKLKKNIKNPSKSPFKKLSKLSSNQNSKSKIIIPKTEAVKQNRNTANKDSEYSYYQKNSSKKPKSKNLKISSSTKIFKQKASTGLIQ